MASRQERRKAERDAAKRAPANAGGAGAAGAAGAAAALANLNVNPLGDWTTQTEDPLALLRAVGAAVVKRKADAGDREAQFTVGVMLMSEANGGAAFRDAPATSPKAQVGLRTYLPTEEFRLLTTAGLHSQTVPQDRGVSIWSPD
jgi:hypothetical protein